MSGELITQNANWHATWSLSPNPDDIPKDCEDNRGSALACRGQSLGENVPITGTPFFLHYESARALGRAGADAVAAADAMGLGGWTLSVHHALQPLLQKYCAGGGCTPYAVVPKAVFLGDGRTLTDANVQAPVAFGGNFYIASPDGSEIYAFDPADGRHLATLSPMLGAVVYSFAYDSSGRLVSVTDATGNVTAISRDAKGNPTAIVSPYGQATALAVDANGYLSRITDPAGNTVSLASSATGLLTRLTDARGNTYDYQYDGLGRLTKNSDPAGGSIALTRSDDTSGYNVTKTTALGRTGRYLVGFSSAAGQTGQQYRNIWTNGLAATAPDAQQHGRLSKGGALPDGSSYSESDGPDPRWGIQVPVAASARTTVGALVRTLSDTRSATLGTTGDPFTLVTQTDRATINGRTYTSAFTAADRTLINTTPEGRTRTVVLDALERVVSTQVGGLLAVDLAYDSRGRVSSVVQGTRRTSLTYDADGRPATLTDPLGHTRSFTYDAAGHLLTTTLPNGGIVKYAYDANGNLAALTPPGKSAHGFAYTAVNLTSAYTPPAVAGAGSTTYRYDADRDPTIVTRPDGTPVKAVYDSAGRPSSLVTPITTINYAYSTKTGNLTAASIAKGEGLAYTYLGSLPTSAAWTGAVAGAVSYGYDNNFWVTSERINGSSLVDFNYDNDGLLIQAGSLALTRSPQNGLVTGTTLGGTVDTRTYNGFGELISYSARYGKTPLYAVTFARDGIGRISKKTESIGGSTTIYSYTYDLNGHLTAVAQNGVRTASYSYDANSNRLTATTGSGTTTATYDAQDRLLSYGKTSYRYTPNGELASQTIGTSTTEFMYDNFGNLLAVRLPKGGVIEYVIDAEGRRVGKRVNGALVAAYLYRGSRIVAQLTAAGEVAQRYIYAARANVPDYMVLGANTYRVFADQLGSPRLVVNAATGQIVEQIDYDEFGNVVRDTNPGFQPFGFAGGLYDRDTGLMRFGARDYSPAIGRWTSKDPILFAGSENNLYAYVSNDPINTTDVFGLADTGTTFGDFAFPDVSPGPGGGIPFVNYTPGEFVPSGGPAPYIPVPYVDYTPAVPMRAPEVYYDAESFSQWGNCIETCTGKIGKVVGGIAAVVTGAGKLGLIAEVALDATAAAAFGGAVPVGCTLGCAPPPKVVNPCFADIHMGD